MKISIVTCVHNQVPEFLEECAQSVAMQEADIEWIVVDDGSSKDAQTTHRDIVQSVSPAVDIQFIATGKNVGLATARNVGLARASGDWIVILDSDDRLSKTLGLALASLPSSSLVACFEALYFGETSFEYRRIGYFEEIFKRHAMSSLDPFLWFDFYYHGLIARKEVFEKIGGYKSAYSVGEDQDLLLRAIEAVSDTQVSFQHFVGYEYRQNPNGVCKLRWPEVVDNYNSSMLEAANRRGAGFIGCRYGGVENIDGAMVDSYEYQLSTRDWLGWRGFKRQIQARKNGTDGEECRTETEFELEERELLQKLDGCQEADLRMDLIEELGHISNCKMPARLEEVLVSVFQEDPNPIVRHEAAFSLSNLYENGEIEGTQARRALCTSARCDSSVVVRHEATESLGSFPHSETRSTLLRLLKDPNEDVVETAKIGLVRIGR